MQSKDPQRKNKEYFDSPQSNDRSRQPESSQRFDQSDCDGEIRRSEGFVQHNGVQLHYLRWTAVFGAPTDPDVKESGHPDTNTQFNTERKTTIQIGAPLILLHGFAQSVESWSNIAPCLARTRTVYALDLIGHGKSDCPDNPADYALETQADALLDFMEAVATWHTEDASNPATTEKINENVSRETSLGGLGDQPASNQSASGQSTPAIKPSVLGYSMGGRVTLMALLRDPNSFGTLILESAGLGPASEQDRARAAASDSARAKTLREQGLHAFMEEWAQLPLFASQSWLPQHVQDSVKASRLNNNAEALARTFECAGQHCMPDCGRMLETLRTTTFPIQYLCGALDEKYSAFATMLASEMDGAIEIHTFENAGHDVHLELPEQFISVVEEFLDSH